MTKPAEGRLSPTHEEIARLAYDYLNGRGQPQGSAQDDWFRAEQELHALGQATRPAQERAGRLRIAVVELPDPSEPTV